MLSIQTFIDGIARWAGNNPEQAVTVIGGVIGAVGHYSRTGRIPIGRLPWRSARRVARELNDRYFGSPRPSGVPAVIAHTNVSELEDVLRERHFESGDLYAYEYRGERFGLRRPSGMLRNPRTGRPTPMELHVRAFKIREPGTLLLAHDEANRFEATGVHLSESMLSWDRGRRELEEILDEAGIDYEPVASEADADVRVLES